MDCGQLVCQIQPVPPDDLESSRAKKRKPAIAACPDINFVCMDVGSGCSYDRSQAVDKNGCPTGCGRVICAAEEM